MYTPRVRNPRLPRAAPAGIRAALLLLGGAILALGSSGCIQTLHHGRHHGGPLATHGRKDAPPPWAPAHGRRQRSDRVEMVFDPELGVHVVIGRDHLYFHAERYYRLEDGAWTASVRLDGPWDRIEVRRLPSGLRKQGKPHHAKHRKGHRGHPAKAD